MAEDYRAVDSPPALSKRELLEALRGSRDEVVALVRSLPAERFATLLAAAAGPCALFAIGLFVSELSIRAGAAASWQTTLLKLVLHPLLMAALVFWLLPVDALWAKIAVVCASLPLGATAFVLAQRYKLLEAETSTGAVVSTAASLFTVSLVMALLA